MNIEFEICSGKEYLQMTGYAVRKEYIYNNVCVTARVYEGKTLEIIPGGDGSDGALPEEWVLTYPFSDFQLSVYKVLSEVKPGERISYGELARRAGKPSGARAVGGCVGRNPFLVVIPCHRVLPATGGIGGFRWGQDMKIRLLEGEIQSL